METGGGVLEQTSVVLASRASLSTALSPCICRTSISLSVPLSSCAGDGEVGEKGNGDELLATHRMIFDSVVKRKSFEAVSSKRSKSVFKGGFFYE